MTYSPCPAPSYLKTVPTRHPRTSKNMSNNLKPRTLKSTIYYIDDILIPTAPQYAHLLPHSTTFFRKEDTSFPFASPHSPSSSVWEHPRGCYAPVARLKHRISKAARPASWPEPPLAGEDSTTSRRKYEVVTPPVNLWSEDEDGQPWYTGPEQFYCAGLPMGSQLSPGRMQQLLRPRAHTTPPHSTPHTTSPPTACNPGV